MPTIRIEVAAKGKPAIVTGRLQRVAGRAAKISLQHAFQADEIKSVSTIGRERPSDAEKAREKVILKALQRSPGLKLLGLPFVRCIWLPSEKPIWPRPAGPANSFYFPSRSLNAAQMSAVKAILSNCNSDRLCLIHGPPGTGKTTVIAASVTSTMARPGNSNSIWIVAQSNVAIKNVAEKLAQTNFMDFKLLVSKDFHYDWWAHMSSQSQR